jgi:hypothetical protein
MIVEWIKKMFGLTHSETLAVAQREAEKQRHELLEVLEKHGLAKDFIALERQLASRVHRRHENSTDLRSGGSGSGVHSQ